VRQIPTTPAAAARGPARLLGPLLALLLLALPATWFVPLFTARVPFLWREEVSIATGLVELWRLDLFLFLVVLLFSVLAPTAKLAASLYVWYRVPLAAAPEALRWLAWLGKLSMTELFLLAVVIVGFKGVGIGRIEVAWGLHAFAGVVLASLAASFWAEAALGRSTSS
jgi:paraquat-inducible protein A